MASWRKLLAKMVADRNPRSYTYEQVANILTNLDFEPAQKPSGSHRKFRREVVDPSAPGGKRGVIIGLVDRGHGPMKPVYVTEMIETLRKNNLLPSEVE